MVLSTVVVSLAAHGSIMLASNNVSAVLLIDPELLNSPFDRTVMQEAIKLAVHFTTAPAWAGYITGPSADLAAALNSMNVKSTLDLYIAVNVQMIWHPVGTVSMSPIGASYGVVDPNLKMKKVAGVRIVDASIWVSLDCHDRGMPKLTVTLHIVAIHP